MPLSPSEQRVLLLDLVVAGRPAPPREQRVAFGWRHGGPPRPRTVGLPCDTSVDGRTTRLRYVARVTVAQAGSCHRTPVDDHGLDPVELTATDWDVGVLRPAHMHCSGVTPRRVHQAQRPLRRWPRLRTPAHRLREPDLGEVPLNSRARSDLVLPMRVFLRTARAAETGLVAPSRVEPSRRVLPRVRRRLCCARSGARAQFRPGLEGPACGKPERGGVHGALRHCPLSGVVSVPLSRCALGQRVQWRRSAVYARRRDQ